MISTTTDDGYPVRCDLCGTSSLVNVSRPPGDSVCPACGTFLWVSAVVAEMQQHSFVPDVRIAQLVAQDRQAAFLELTEIIGKSCEWTPQQEAALVDALLQREELGPTSIGRGLALPHAAVDWLDRSVSAIALAPHGIDFQSLDGRPVYTIVLMAFPKSRPAEKLRQLEAVSRSLREANLWRS